jgi:pimeloyl-ACP methyl ester carboxylesterase
LRVLYLHGFASSPQSSKRTFLAAKLAEYGVELHSPDFNAPDFSTLTITRMLGQVADLIDSSDTPVTLIGSSLGGFAAVQTALAMPQKIARLVLLAPALDFNLNRLRELGDRSLDDWKTSGELNVFHYGYGRYVPLHYGFYTDARRYDCATARLGMPIQIFQGRRDTAVSASAVEQWAGSRPNVELHLLDDDHQLAASLDYIWKEMAAFLGISDLKPLTPPHPQP